MSNGGSNGTPPVSRLERFQVAHRHVKLLLQFASLTSHGFRREPRELVQYCCQSAIC